jgi:hypothetical protein
VGATFDYQLFGLRIRSEVPLPELFPAKGAGTPDVTIRRSPLPVGNTPGLSGDRDALFLTVPEVARYRIDGGREILIDPEEGVPIRNVRLFLLGSAFGALLHQRGMLPLHANAVEIGGKAVAFMGESGAGKSTLAAWFHDRGFRVIADDVCVVEFGANGGAVAMPGVPRLRLWEDVLAATGRTADVFERSYLTDQNEKYDVPISVESTASDPLEIAAIFAIGRGTSTRIERLTGLAAAEAVYAHTYRGAFVETVGGAERLWLSAVKLVRGVPIYRLERIWDLAAMDEEFAAAIETAVGQLRPVKYPL